MYFAETPDQLLDQEGLLSMSGLEFMQGILDGTLPAPPISRVLNYRLHSVREGRVAFRGTPGFDHTNPMGTVHGGWYGTLVDSCMACAVMTLVPKGSVYTTLEFKTNIIRPIKLGTEIEAVGTSQHTGRSTGVAVAELRGVEDGKLYATGSTTCIVMKMR